MLESKEVAGGPHACLASARDAHLYWLGHHNHHDLQLLPPPVGEYGTVDPRQDSQVSDHILYSNTIYLGP